MNKISPISVCPSARQSSGRARRRGGFTLIELLVVISIAAVVSAITLGGIMQLGANNKRITCQSNLAQIYKAARLYMQDEGAFPYRNTSVAADNLPDEPNIGLWALYAFPGPDPINPAGPLVPRVDGPRERYVRSAKVLHCPADDADDNGTLIKQGPAPDKIEYFNPEYLSYQKLDPNNVTVSSYESIRTTDSASGNWNRQLLHFEPNGANVKRVFRSPSDNTVVTWCPFHRTGTGGRNFDNVLFYDGSVQLIPSEQRVVHDAGTGVDTVSQESGTCTAPSAYPGTGCYTTWTRLPKPPA
jgi:prepilin-type N-terminal cleavage/methylation domain-containing protein